VCISVSNERMPELIVIVLVLVCMLGMYVQGVVQRTHRSYAFLVTSKTLSVNSVPHFVYCMWRKADYLLNV